MQTIVLLLRFLIGRSPRQFCDRSRVVENVVVVIRQTENGHVFFSDARGGCLATEHRLSVADWISFLSSWRTWLTRFA